MSQEISEAQAGDASGSQVSSSDADAVITKVDGEWGIQLRIVPPQGQSDGRPSDATAQQMREALRGFLRLQEDQDDDSTRKLKEMRAWLTLLATITASVTYQAGLNPPGGFWQADDSQGHRAGNPVLRDEHWSRYQTFYYLNATSFVTSLAMVMVLVSDRFFSRRCKVGTLVVTACINVASLIGAYAAGSTLSNSSTMFMIIITCIAFVGIIYLGEVMVEMYYFVMTNTCMEKLAGIRWFPIPAEVVDQAKKIKAERRRRRSVNKSMAICCSCCAPTGIAA